MIFIIFALIVGALWYVADKQLKERFMPHIKWSSLAIIVFFVLFDINMMIETSRYIDVQSISPGTGITFSYFSNETNSTVVTTMYGRQTDDSGAIMAYHYTEFMVWPILTGLLQYVFYFISGMIVIQLLSLWYDTYRGAK